MKESVNGIGGEVDDLFKSNLIEDDKMNVSRINREFEGLLL